MDKLKYIKLENEDGTYSSSIPLSVDSDHVDVGQDNLTNVLNTKANASTVNQNIESLSTEINTQKTRIDNLATLEDGSTTGDAELQDIRIGYNGVIYNNAGTAVRTQINEIKNSNNFNYSSIEELLNINVNKNEANLWKYGTISQGEFKNATNRLVTAHYIKPNKYFSIKSKNGYKFYICAFDKDGTPGGWFFNTSTKQFQEEIYETDNFIFKEFKDSLGEYSYLRFVLKDVNNPDITINENAWQNVEIYNENISQTDLLKENIKDWYKDINTYGIWKYGGLNSDGTHWETQKRIITEEYTLDILNNNYIIKSKNNYGFSIACFNDNGEGANPLYFNKWSKRFDKTPMYIQGSFSTSELLDYVGEYHNIRLILCNTLENGNLDLDLKNDFKNIEIIKKKNNESIVYENIIKEPYWILHVDCGRKYFSVNNIKKLLDEMSLSNFNQLQLHFSEDTGFRFGLNDMNFIDEDNNTYDLTSCLGGKESPNRWWTEVEMDDIINYAHNLNIDVVPSLDMPGHMGRILSHFSSFKYQGTNTLDFTNETAVKFAKAIVDKYCKWFVSRGCHFYNMGYDEVAGYYYGFNDIYNEGLFNYVTNFANTLSSIIKKNGLVPRIFNEPVHYENDYKYMIDKDIEVYYWCKNQGQLALPSKLQNMGYKIINTNAKYYWTLDLPNLQVNEETLRKAKLLTDFRNQPTIKNGSGATLCIWCDMAGQSSSDGDEGNSIIIAVTSLIKAFGYAINKYNL